MSEEPAKAIKLDGRRIKSREKLKKAMAILLQEKSLEKVTIEEISKAAEVTRPTFYSNYKDLQAIVIEHVEELMMELVEEFVKIDTDTSLSPQQRIEAGLVFYIDMLQKNDCILLSTAAGRAGNEALELMRKYNMRILLVRADRVQDSGLSPMDLQIAMFFFSGAINTVLEAHASGKIDISAEELSHSIATLIHQGLGQELGDPAKLDRPEQS